MAKIVSTAQKLNTISVKNIADCQNHLRQVIRSKSFLNNEGLNNDSTFPYLPV